MSLRDKILECQSEKTEEIKVPGVDEPVYVRPLRLEERIQHQAVVQHQMKRIFVDLIMRCLRDAEGESLFPDRNEAAELMKKPFEWLREIYDQCLAPAGIDAPGGGTDNTDF